LFQNLSTDNNAFMGPFGALSGFAKLFAQLVFLFNAVRGKKLGMQ
jgi:hypothetical protein